MTNPPHHPTDVDLAGVRTDLLDCVQANLAVLADRAHGPGTHLALGASLTFRYWPAEDGLPTVDPPLDVQLERAESLLGLAVRDRGRVHSEEELIGAARDGRTRYVVADAFQLPWLPYHGRVHMDHSFLLTVLPGGRTHVTDAYDIETRWGPAVPGTRILDTGSLAGIRAAEILRPEKSALAPVPAATCEQDPVAVAAYGDAYESFPDRALALERLTAETWLLARSRKLHATGRAAQAGRPDATAAEREHLAAWDKVVEQTYLAHRRVARGRPEVPGVVDRLREVLAADLSVFRTEESGSTVPGPEEALRHRVAGVAAAVLGISAAELLAGAELGSFAAFSSFRLVEIVDRIEDELGRELDAGELIPENLRTVDDLCRMAS